MYQYLSYCYDSFMSDVDYDVWANRIIGILGDRKKGIDCGCGSGNITLRLKKAGYDVVGMDISPDMLNVAKQNFIRNNVDIPLIKMDAEKLSVPGKADFITAVCDVVNYMKSPGQFFARAYSALNNGGVLIFDISSKHKLTEIIGNNVFTDSSGDTTYIWTNHLSNKKNKVEMYLTFFIKNSSGSYDKREERQVQYIYESDQLISLLKGNGFTKVMSGGFEGKRNRNLEQRLFFVAYKGIVNEKDL